MAGTSGPRPHCPARRSRGGWGCPPPGASRSGPGGSSGRERGAWGALESGLEFLATFETGVPALACSLGPEALSREARAGPHPSEPSFPNEVTVDPQTRHQGPPQPWEPHGEGTRGLRSSRDRHAGTAGPPWPPSCAPDPSSGLAPGTETGPQTVTEQPVWTVPSPDLPRTRPPDRRRPRPLTVLSLCCCCCSCFMRMDFFLSLQRLFWNQTRMTRGLRPVISTSCSFMSASGRGLAA